ncbi:MAG TPA: acyltransferase [Bacteroidales bacterium]|nr:acyltransferase [Bacteroidales bacterium]
MQKGSNANHNYGIDLFRGLAILSVILLHINIRIPFNATFLGGLLSAPLYKIIFLSGYYGVCTFFVISGFLITTSALNKWNTLPQLSLKGFYAMRFARIMPLLAALLLVLAVLHATGVTDFVIDPGQTSLGRAVVAALGFHINWLEIQVGYLPASWDILWSLSIEEVFYLFFPLLCFICRKEWHFVALVSVFLVVSPFARTIFYAGNELGDKNHFAYLDAISLGCIAAIVARRVKFKEAHLLIVAVIGWVLFAAVIFFRKWVYATGVTSIGLNISFLAIGMAMILIWMQKRYDLGRQTFAKHTGFLRFLGRNSYEIYLTHMFVVIAFVHIYDSLKLRVEWAWVLYIAVIVVSGVFGNVVAVYFSNPFNKFIREKFRRSSYGERV